MSAHPQLHGPYQPGQAHGVRLDPAHPGNRALHLPRCIFQEIDPPTVYGPQGYWD